MKTLRDLFHNHRREDGGEEYSETRISRKPYMDDNVWRPMVVQYVYEQGPIGIKMDRLAQIGIDREWWQDTVAKHFGEKMRVAFSTGLVFVPIYPTVTTLQHIRVVHPKYVVMTFDSSVIQKDSDRVREYMLKLDYVKQDKT